MSAGPDGRYVRCTASDWGDALLYWWAVMFPSYVCARTKEIGNATKEIGNAVLRLFGSTVDRIYFGSSGEELEAINAFGSVGVTAQEAVEE